MGTFVRSRRVALVTVVSASLLALAGCATTGSSEETAAPSDAAQSEETSDLLPAAEGTTQYPLTIETAWGETVLEERPTRIAAVTPTAVDTEILAGLGVTPVIASSNIEYPWIQDALPAEVETVYESGMDALPLEEIAAAEPDLIIVLETDLTEQFDQLAAIAPVVAAPTAEDAEADWESSLPWVAEALDLQQAADDLLAERDETFATIAEEHPEFAGKTASYVVVYPGDTGVQYWSWAGSDTEKVFLEMGFDANPLAEKFGPRGAVSNELIADIDADVVLVSDNAQGDIASFTDQQVFQALPAAQANHVAIVKNTGDGYEFEGTTTDGSLAWALARSGPLSSQWSAVKLADIFSVTLAR